MQPTDPETPTTEDASPVPITPLSTTPVLPAPFSSRPPGTRRGRAAAVVFAIALFFGGVLVGRVGVLAPSGASAPEPAVSQVPAAGATASGAPAASSNAADFALIQQAWDLLHQNYVGRADLDDRDLAYGAIQGLTEAVGDTGHTSFETPDELKQEESALQGQYVGIGAVVDTVDGKPQIKAVFPESPAAKAGIGAGDTILAIDGASTADLSFDDIGSKIRGPEGSVLTLQIDPPGDAGPREVKVTRAKVTIPAVEWAMVPGTDTADVRILQFSSGTTQKVADAIKGAKDAGAKRILLDLRQNPGGFVDDAVGVASQFVPEGTTVYVTQDASGTKAPVKSRGGGVATDLPVVILVDRSTASSAEIVASAIQEAGRAKVIGEKTFGTGTVLARFDLKDGSALRIGTIRWLTANGTEIWHTGIEPDQVVALAEGVQPLTPPDLAKLGAGGLASSKDAQLLAGLRALGWNG